MLHVIGEKIREKNTIIKNMVKEEPVQVEEKTQLEEQDQKDEESEVEETSINSEDKAIEFIISECNGTENPNQSGEYIVGEEVLIKAMIRNGFNFY